MNDPLRDNRIFPEEMQQHPEETVKKPMNTSWVWILVGIGILGALGYLAYTTFQTQQEQKEYESALEKEHNEQVEYVNTITNAIPPQTSQERDEKLKVFFGTNE